MPTRTPTVGVSERALLARVRRKLAQEGENLVADRRDPRAANWLGLYIVSERNTIVAQNCDLEALARELDCMRPWERLEEPT